MKERSLEDIGIKLQKRGCEKQISEGTEVLEVVVFN
jgi:hypothetical protein